jgi:hypothetical protein
MIGVFMFWKGLSFEGDGSFTDGLLCDDPILKKLSLWECELPRKGLGSEDGRLMMINFRLAGGIFRGYAAVQP